MKDTCLTKQVCCFLIFLTLEAVLRLKQNHFLGQSVDQVVQQVILTIVYSFIIFLQRLKLVYKYLGYFVIDFICAM
jgi:hypothetical protein